MAENKYGTPYTESEAILAATQGDGGYLLALALKMLVTERRDLLNATRYLESAFEGFLDTERYPEPKL